MLINKYLINSGYIFIKDTNPLYIQAIINLGSIPIFVYIKNGKRILCKGICVNIFIYDPLFWQELLKSNEIYITKDNYNKFEFDYCSISEIKRVLSNADIFYYDQSRYYPRLSNITSIYFFNLNSHVEK